MGYGTDKKWQHLLQNLLRNIRKYETGEIYIKRVESLIDGVKIQVIL